MSDLDDSPLADALPHVERRLAAIVSADVKEYSRLKHGGDLRGRAFVADGELLLRLTRVQVSPRLGRAAGAHRGDGDADEAVAEHGWLARRARGLRPL